MAAKRVQVSIDSGTTYLTLPGATGEFREDTATVNDTIFGQSYESMQPSIAEWQVTGDSFFKGVAGYQANLMQGGTPTTMTNEATALVSGKTYKISNAAHILIDYFTPVTVKDNGVDHTADVQSVDYLNGSVTFKSAYTITGAVTITGKYLPKVSIAKGRQFTCTQTAAEKDITVYEDARANGGWREFDYGLKTVKLDITGVYAYSNGFSAAMASRAPIIVEIGPANDQLTVFRGFFKFNQRTQTGNVGALEQEQLQLALWVPDGSLVQTPFAWYFDPTSTLNVACQNAINCWQNSSTIMVRYQDDPSIVSSGHVGTAIVTEATLANTFDGQNTFTFGFRGTGVHTQV